MTANWLIAILGALVVASPGGAQVVTAQYDNARTGSNLHETRLSPQSVNAAAFGKVGALSVDGDVYAQVLYLPSVTIPGKGKHAVIFVATEHNSVYAFDASVIGAPLWRVNLSGANGSTLVVRDVACPFIRPEVGITPTPVIDTTTGTMYLLARTKEHGSYVQRLHALDVTTGAPRHEAVQISASVRGTGAGSSGGVVAFDARRENPRAALLLTNGRVILSWASSCDVGPYHGWLMAYDARTLAQVAAFNATPDGADGGIWQGDAGPAADAAGHIFAATGNGTFDAASGGRDYGDSILELSISASGFDVVDYFTPFDEKMLNEQDGDLGSGGPLLVPRQPGPRRDLLFMGGKGGGVYLLERGRLGRFTRGGDSLAVQTMKAPGMVMGAAAYWNGRIYTLWSSDVIRSFGLTNGQVNPAPSSQGSHRFADPGATPTVSSNGGAGGIVWVVETRTWNGSDRPAVLHAYDASNVARELYSSELNAARDRAGVALRFAIPTVAGGRVYVGTKGEVDVYAPLVARPTGGARTGRGD
ncbi:MAG TPA: hypothetical protein VN651_01805 [Gemmatimonadaceae bacterium]|nr:hypothetical protein [Gemmatimonadaceae bacterium]